MYKLVEIELWYKQNILKLNDQFDTVNASEHIYLNCEESGKRSGN